jgi:hypothetical protein
MSRVTFTMHARRQEPAGAKKPAPKVSGTPPRARRGDRLSPGDVALEREADAYAAGRTDAALRRPGVAPTSLRGGGVALPQQQRRLHEARLGRDLSGLRLHADPLSQQEAAAHGAQALADGGDVMLAHGRFRPGTESGNRLIAHEVAHVVQQADGRGRGPALKTATASRPEMPVSVCGLWSDTTRAWFQRRLRELGVGTELRGVLANLGIGAVEKLTFQAVEEAIGATAADRRETTAIMSALQAACRQEGAR